jgi:hypothetical protein
VENKYINLEVLFQVASGLGELIEQVVFVGGAVVSLYADSKFSDLVRPTSDIDMAVDIAEFGKQSDFQQKFRQKGFAPDIYSSTFFRHHFQSIQVDLISTSSSVFGDSNSWYKPGFSKRIFVELQDLQIPILPLVYFLATKFEAYNNRGGGDYRISTDFEDIVYVVNYNENVVDIVSEGDNTVKNFLLDEFMKVVSHKNFEEIIYANLDYLNRDERLIIVKQRFKQISQL